MKKSFLFLFLLGTLHAEDDCNRCALPPQPDPICETGGSSFLFYNSPIKEECWTFFITGDFIYWRASVEGLAYSASKWRNNLNENPSHGSVKHPDFEFEPGFKVGLGTRIAHDGWELYSEYTWLQTGDKTNSTENANPLSTTSGATWFIKEAAPDSLLQPDFPLLTSARTRWDLHFNSIDLSMARTSRVGRRFDLRPHFGFKGSWQKQHYSTHYTVNSNLADSTMRRMSQDIDYWGFGMRTGFDAAFHLNKWFRILGETAISGLWSGIDVDRLDRSAPADGSGAEVVTFNTSNSYHTIVPVMEMFLGLRWEKRFNENLNNYMMQLGWEQQVWWNMNKFYGVYEQGSHGALTLQGLTFQLRLDF